MSYVNLIILFIMWDASSKWSCALSLACMSATLDDAQCYHARDVSLLTSIAEELRFSK